MAPHRRPVDTIAGGVASASAEAGGPFHRALRGPPPPLREGGEARRVDRADAANGRVYKAKRLHYNAESLS